MIPPNTNSNNPQASLDGNCNLSNTSHPSPPLRIADASIPSCGCGETICGSDCHFLHQKLKATEGDHSFHSAIGDEGSEDLKHQHCRVEDAAIAGPHHRLRRHFSVGFEDKIFEVSIALEPSSVGKVPLSARASLRRTKSCGMHSAEFHQTQLRLRSNSYRMRIDYHDEALRERCEQNTQALLQRAMSDDSDATSTATILARKALRYRRVLERLEGVDITDPSLDVSRCLGVRWQRVGSTEQ